VSEERASHCLTQKTVTTQCEAKLAQERNGINGKGPRSGKQTVYAGFDLEQASLRTARVGLVERSVEMDCGIIPCAIRAMAVGQDLRAFSNVQIFGATFFWNVSRPKLEGLAFSLSCYRFGLLVRSEHHDVFK
jgi:hypothetical protein